MHICFVYFGIICLNSILILPAPLVYKSKVVREKLKCLSVKKKCMLLCEAMRSYVRLELKKNTAAAASPAQLKQVKRVDLL